MVNKVDNEMRIHIGDKVMEPCGKINSDALDHISELTSGEYQFGYVTKNHMCHHLWLHWYVDVPDDKAMIIKLSYGE